MESTIVGNHNNVLVFTFCLANPGSITNTTPSIVRDVSAIFVETTIFLPIAPFGRRAGADSKILCCKLGGRVEYSGIQLTSPMSEPRLSISRLILLHASSISYWERTKNSINIFKIEKQIKPT